MRRIFLIATLSLSLSLSGHSQGCSDAGFCTMGAMRPNQNVSHKTQVHLRTFEVSQYIGYTKFNDAIFNYVADFNFALSGKYSGQVKLPYAFIRGPLANTNGIGDVSLSFSRNLIAKENYQWNASIGTKIPTGKPDKKIDGLPLPMYYQTTLGTYDLIFGTSFITRKWLLATGIQHPLNKVNSEFAWAPWNSTNLAAEANLYPKSKDLKRGTDVMLRIERNFRFAKFNTYVGLLSIYRLNEDTFFDPTLAKRIASPGSSGLAMTGLVGIGYHISTRSTIKFLLGRGIIQRERNPDGLSRDYVNNISYEIKF